MPKLLTALMDIVFPPSAEELLIRNTPKEILLAKYRPGTYSNITFLSQYHDPVIRAAIRENKFHYRTKAASLLALLLKQHTELFNDKTAFIPIPLGRKRSLDRGHNQITTVLEAAGLTEQILTDILIRTTETRSQSHLTKVERLRNIQDAFSCTGRIDKLQDYEHLILIDDVVTTGATMQAAKSTLAPQLPPQTKLSCLALAH
jgi:ComF family protein